MRGERDWKIISKIDGFLRLEQRRKQKMKNVAIEKEGVCVACDAKRNWN